MLQMMDIRANGYKLTAMKLEHFPVHMSAEGESYQVSRKVLAQVLPAPRKRLHFKVSGKSEWEDQVASGREVRVWEVVTGPDDSGNRAWDWLQKFV